LVLARETSLSEHTKNPGPGPSSTQAVLAAVAEDAHAAFPKKSNWIPRKIADSVCDPQPGLSQSEYFAEIPPSAIALHLPQVFLRF